MKLLESTGNKTNKNKSGNYLAHLEITKVILVHCNIVTIDYQQYSTDYCTHLFPINHLVVY